MSIRTRRLLILAIGLIALIVITWIGTSLESWLPRHSAIPEQQKLAGPYQVTLLVSPTPPTLTESSEITIQVVRQKQQELVTDAQVHIQFEMTEMDMGENQLAMESQNNGNYSTRFRFTMIGAWQLYVTIQEPGEEPQQVMFEVTVQ